MDTSSLAELARLFPGEMNSNFWFRGRQAKSRRMRYGFSRSTLARGQSGKIYWHSEFGLRFRSSVSA
jgi:hypothetical protein